MSQLHVKYRSACTFYLGNFYGVSEPRPDEEDCGKNPCSGPSVCACLSPLDKNTPLSSDSPVVTHRHSEGWEKKDREIGMKQKRMRGCGVKGKEER